MISSRSLTRFKAYFSLDFGFWNLHCSQAHAQYMENTEKRTKEFKALLESDADYQDEITKQTEAIERSQVRSGLMECLF